MQVAEQPAEPPDMNGHTTLTAPQSLTSVHPRMASFVAGQEGPGPTNHEARYKQTAFGDYSPSDSHPYNASSPGSATSDYDATPRGEHPPQLSSTFTTVASPSPRKALHRYKTVKPSPAAASSTHSILHQRRNMDKPESSNTEDGDLPVRNDEHTSKGKGTSSGIMMSHATKRKELRTLHDIDPQDDGNVDSPGGSYILKTERSSLKDGGSTRTGNITRSREHSRERQEQSDQAPHSSIASNGSTSSGSTENGTETPATSPSSRPWLLSRSSSSTIDIPIESAELGSPQEAQSALEEKASMAVSSDSYFPDVTALQRVGVLEATEDASSSGSHGIPAQNKSPPDAGAEKGASSTTVSPPNDRKTKSMAWPCSKRHGDTPIGMSVALSLTDALGFKLGNPNAQIKSGTPTKAAPTKGSGEDVGLAKDAASDSGSLSPTSQPHASAGQKENKDLRRQMSESQASSMATDRFLSSSAPVGKQASLSQQSAARSMEDSLLESWGFTVSTPLCPPKCYPLSSPALNSVPKERFCRASSSSSFSSAEKDDSRRRFSTSTPPASMNAKTHAAALGNSLGSRKSYTFGSGDNYDMQKRTDAPVSRSRLDSITTQPRTSSPMRDVTSDSPTSGRRPSLLHGTSNDSNSGHSEAVSSRSNTPASSRHNSATGSDLYGHSRPWRRDSAMSAQSFDTTGTSRSSGVFSIDLVDHPGRHGDESTSPGERQDGTHEAHPSDAFQPSAIDQPAEATSTDDPSDPDASHCDEPHVAPYEGVVNIIPYEDKYLISAIMEGFTLDNITVAVKSVRNGIDKPVADDNCSVKSFGSTNSGKSITAGNQTRKTKCVHLVADRWDDGGECFPFNIGFVGSLTGS
ncbi:hypothetical protein QFC22_006057 [Naganishia vaughanmartiniae]|uniref:Uncharacterized protein n=1 Tax=Naganishia vaughanmartiniae TaxID=1424756 RepID=A0ACC2WP29_9TREE|nr:hypothetical protein QFC22_006057 [Naganishia vaughanmartiniae]